MPPSTFDSRAAARALLATFLAATATACVTTARIGTLLDDPSEYDGRRVRIEGQVTQPVGVPLVGGTYVVDDGTGAVRVVTEQGGGVPRDGAAVRVVGIFRALFQIGNESLSVLQERDREVR